MNVRPAVATLCAFGVGAVLHIAALSKIIDPSDALAWASVFPLGDRIGPGVVAMVVGVELALAWCLMLGLRQRQAAGYAVLLTGLFGIALLGWPPDGRGCPCFGGFPAMGNRVPPVFRDMALLAASLAAWRFTSSQESPAHASHDQADGSTGHAAH